MEYGLRLYVPASTGVKIGGLNPCFNGIWSATLPKSILHQTQDKS